LLNLLLFYSFVNEKGRIINFSLLERKIVLLVLLNLLFNFTIEQKKSIGIIGVIHDAKVHL